MQINSLSLKNFRNYTQAVINFAPKINIIVGKNAQGKTNLLESIYFCALGKSPKTTKERMLIKYDESTATAKINFNTRAGKKLIEVYLSNTSKKSLKVNGICLSRVSNLIGELKVVYFSPDELRLIKEVPEDRRRFLDISISQLDKEYLLSLLRYEKVLKQRNAILKKNISPENAKAELEIWSPQFLVCAEKIINSRIDFINKLKLESKKIHSLLSEKELLELEYSFSPKKGMDIRQTLEYEMTACLQKELELGYTMTGPHRDDIRIMLDGKDTRYYASQGQQRTVALSLKLAEMEIFFNETGEYPILLLDDVMSELDTDREKRLYQLVEKYQTLITTTKNDFSGNKNLITIENGNIVNFS